MTEVASIAVKGYAAFDKEQELKPFEYTMDNIGSLQVVVKVTHCGVCYSDIDCIDDAFGWSKYPFIPGHEVVGEVVAMGANVGHLQLGQRVGIGPNRSSCMNCVECNNGFEQLCEKAIATLQPGEHGGFADHICISSEWVIPVPDNLDSISAAPLMCAGVTAFTPLRLYTNSLMNVGVVGVGGLGHLSVQFAAAMGNEVTAFVANPTADDITAYKSLGATHVVNFANREDMGPAASTQDFIFSTIYGGDVGLKPFIRVLKPRGRLCVVGAAMEPMDFPAARLVFGQKSIMGSTSGGREHTREMLEFAGKHGIKPITETMKMSEVNAAIDKVKKQQVHFRMVLINDLST
ncbi:MAG: NAD(P)-dependent alcohol dehydrogenase [Halioglobus sp.]